jgi:hypothetical protein
MGSVTPIQWATRLKAPLIVNNQNGEVIMLDILRDEPYVPAPETMPRRSAVWNRRLLTVAIVLILWAASVLMLQMAGPDARAFVAGEGMLITDLR